MQYSEKNHKEAMGIFDTLEKKLEIQKEDYENLDDEEEVEE